MHNRREKLEALFEAAAALESDAQQRDYLDRACPDAELRKEVESLLEAKKHPDSLFDQGDFLSESTLEATPVLEQAGTVIGRYKLLQKVGEGGMGVVYMAEQTEPVTRKVALKIIKLGMDTKQVVARFEAERQALAMMDHPNIAKVFDAGASDAGRPYFVMELVRGVPITEYCDKNKLSPQDRLELFIPVCQAIQHAHQKGVIHRDIKPSNVMVTLHDGNPVPKVIDFGIAKATNQKLTEKTLFTNYAQMIGTPAYMSPEQAEMSGLDVDTRTDVYSLGVLLYELLTSTTPFSGNELLSMGYGEMQKIIAEKEPPKPSTRMSTLQNEERTVVARNRSIEISALGQAFKGDLDWIVMKALDKDRARRYETANALALDVKRHLNNEPVSAAAPTFAYQLRKFYRRNRSYMRVAAAVLVLLALAAVLAGVQAVKATREERLARTAQGAAEVAERVAIAAKEDTRIKLYHSLVDQARAVQLARRSGFKDQVWQLLKDAMSIGDKPVDPSELRSIAAACLDVPNRLERGWTNLLPNAGTWSLFETGSEKHIAMGSDAGRVEVYDVADGRLKLSLAGGHSAAIVSVAKLNAAELWATSDATGNMILWRQAPGGGVGIAQRHLRADEVGGIPQLLACGSGLLAYAAGSSTILIWESTDSPQPRIDQLPFRVTPDWASTWAVRLSPDGRYLLAAARTASERDASAAHVWDLIAQEEAAVLPAPVGAIRVLFSGDGSVALCASSHRVIVYDARQWRRLTSLRPKSWGDANQVALSWDGRLIAFGGGIKSIWNLDSDLEMSTLTEADGHPILSEDGSRLTILRTALPELLAKRWELGKSDTLSTVETNSGIVWGLGISPDGRYLASSGPDGRVNLWCLHPWERLALEDGDLGTPVEDPSFSFDGRLLAVMHGPWTVNPGENKITFWDLTTRRRTRSISFGKDLGLVSFHDSRPLVAAAAGNSVGVWRYRLESGKSTVDVDLQLDLIREIPLQRPSFMVGMEPQGRFVFWSENENPAQQNGWDRAILRAMDLETGGMLAFSQPVSSGWNEFAFLPDGRSVVFAACGSEGRPGRIEIWDFLTNQRLAQFADSSFPEGPTPSVLGLHRDGRHLVFQSTRNEALELWDIEAQRMLCRLPLPEGLITQSRGAAAGLKWSPNGDLLAVPLSTGQIRLWNIPAVRRALAELDLDW